MAWGRQQHFSQQHKEKKGITQSKTQLWCSSRSRGLQTKVLLLSKEERELEKLMIHGVKDKVQTWLSRVPLAFHVGFAGALIIQQNWPAQGMKDQLYTGDLLPGVTSSVGQGDAGTPALLPHASTRAGGSHSLTWL